MPVVRAAERPEHRARATTVTDERDHDGEPRVQAELEALCRDSADALPIMNPATPTNRYWASDTMPT